MEGLALGTSTVLLVPYLAWGIHLLVRRFRYHEEEPPLLEAATLLFVLLFVVLQVVLLRAYMPNEFLDFIFAVLGLIVSAAALYGHVLVSFLSRGIVDMMTPDPDGAVDVPRLGPAQALERCEDFEGALQECLVLARIYPRDPGVQMHIAQNLQKLARFEESAAWYEKASLNSTSHEPRLLLAIRAVEVFQRDLQRPEEAVQVLERYLEGTPDGPNESHVRDHIARLSAPIVVEQTLTGLDALDAMPMGVVETSTAEAWQAAEQHGVALELDEAPMSFGESGNGAYTSQLISLESLDLADLDEERREQQAPSSSFSLEAMDDLPLELPPAPKRGSGIRRKPES
jgi:tetratricopeptide (TPR) repeat protein